VTKWELRQPRYRELKSNAKIKAGASRIGNSSGVAIAEEASFWVSLPKAMMKFGHKNAILPGILTVVEIKAGYLVNPRFMGRKGVHYLLRRIVAGKSMVTSKAIAARQPR
jgi:hypothetical protein